IGGLDEIFQSRRPVLVGADGFAPDATIADAGTSLRAGRPEPGHVPDFVLLWAQRLIRDGGRHRLAGPAETFLHGTPSYLERMLGLSRLPLRCGDLRGAVQFSHIVCQSPRGDSGLIGILPVQTS